MKIFRSSPGITLLIAFSFLLLAACGKSRKTGMEEQAQAAAAWRVIGPGGGGGQFEPTINPSDQKHVFVRCDMTGAYVTEDEGLSWKMFNLRTVVQDFEFDPGNVNIVYAANTGLYRSEDRGRSWRLIYPAPSNVVAERMLGDHAEQHFETVDGMPDGPIDKVRVDPSRSDHLYLGLATSWRTSAANAPGYAPGKAKLMVSTDRGASWKLLAQLTGRRVLAVFPGSREGRPGQVAAVTETTCVIVDESTGKAEEIPLPVSGVISADGGKSDGGTVIYILARMQQESGGTVSGGIYRSADCGRTWTQVNSNLLDGWKDTGRLPDFATLAVCEGNPGVAYLSCRSYTVKVDGNQERNFGIFKTQDSGKTWTWVYRADNEKVITANYGGGWMARFYGPEWGEYPLALGVSPTNENICYATDFGCTYRTLDGGANWEQVYSRDLPDGSVTTRGLDVTTCYGVHFDPFDKNHFFISYTDIGLWHTFSGGESWFHSVQGVPRPWWNTCYWVAFDPETKGRVWSVWGSGHDLPRPKMFRSGNFGRFVGGVAVSRDGGLNWEACNEGMPANTVSTHVLVDPSSPADSRTLYVCGFGKGVFKSKDGGRSWTLMNSGLGPNLNAWRMVLLPSGKLFLLVARGLENGQTVDGALYASDNGADSWQIVKLPEGVNAPNDLVYDPSDPARMYLSCWPWPRDNREHCGGLYRTDDGGAGWKLVFDEEAHVYAAAVDPENPSTVFINTFDSAAFRSDDRGESWYRLRGYTFKWGHRPAVDPHHPGMLYLTTFGGSVFYGPAAGVPGAVEDIQDGSFLRW